MPMAGEQAAAIGTTIIRVTQRIGTATTRGR